MILLHNYRSVIKCVFVHLPLGDSRTGGPSINVGGERRALVSDDGRPIEGLYIEVSAKDEGKFGLKFSDLFGMNVWI